MDVVAHLPADPQAAEPVQMGERTLDNPTLSAQPGSVLGSTASDQRFHPQPPDQAPVLVVVVPAVSEDNVGAPPRTAALAPHGRHRLQERDELGDVVAVAAPVSVTASGMPEASVIR
jgi:hypothetical protein